MTSASTQPKTRVRTGCLTCRKKKIKCDERKPICANCDKPGRICRYELVSRDHHNPSVNSNIANNLDKFFHDRPAPYSIEQTANFVRIPRILQWAIIRTPDNFEDEVLDQADMQYLMNHPHLVRAQEQASNGLEALSAAAADYNTHPLGSMYSQPYNMNTAAIPQNNIDPSLDTRQRTDDETQTQSHAAIGSPARRDAADEQLAQALRLHVQAEVG